MSLVPFFIPNSSPVLSYSPCVDCGGQGESWQSAYTPRPDGFDQTFHQTTGEGHTVSFNLTSNGFGVTHATVSPECPLEYSINGSSFLSTCSPTAGLQDLPFGRHEVILRTGNITIFQLFGITGNHLVTKGDNVNRTLDDSSSVFTYTPAEAWGFLKDDGSLAGNTGLLDDYNDTSGQKVARSVVDFEEGLVKRAAGSGRSLAVTNSSAAVDLVFKGSAVYVYGLSAPECGQARVKLDNQEVANLNMTSIWKTSGLLYTTSGLDAGVQHHLSIENLVDGKQLVVDYAIVTSIRPTKSKPNAPLIAGVTGGIVIIILLGVVFYYYLVARMKYKLSQPSYSHSGSQPRTPNSAAKVDSWRKQTPPQSADQCSPMETYHSESIYGGILAPLAPKLSKKKKSGSGNWPIAKLYTKRRQSFATLRSDSGGTNLSAPSFPDFIAYKSPSMVWTPTETDEPVPSIPNTALLSSRLGTSNLSRTGHSPLFSANSNSRTITPRVKSPATPPAIVGLDSTAERWVQENTYIGGQQQVGRSHSTGSHRSGHSDVSRTDAGSPIPVTAFQITQAQIARRSTARWPPAITTEDIPLRNNSSPFIDDSLRPPAAAVTPHQTVPVSASLTTTTGMGIGTVSADSYPSYIRSSPHQSTSYAFQTPHLATYTPTSGSPTRSPRPPTPATSSSYPQGGLRRGVSVKSAKSLKSLFSGWQRPTHERSETPARPDSGIFPALGLGSVDVPLHTSNSCGSRSRSGSGNGSRGGGGANMFIELDPESPLTASRPPSEWPRGKVWVSGGRV